MRILCRTLFDCTYTGITGSFRANQLPIVDRSGKTIDSQQAWNFARNQQRNWETIMQMISLRAQPTIVNYPVNNDASWEFVFEVENSAVYSENVNVHNYNILLKECNNIPMILGLGECKVVDPQLITQGEFQNIWFESVNN